MRKKIVAGNWKMNLGYEDALDLIKQYAAFVGDTKPTADVIIATSFLYLKDFVNAVNPQYVKIAAQDVSAYEKGAYTGDVAASQLTSVGVKYSLVGHSERREYQGETDELIGNKMVELYKNNQTPIFCIGEKLEEREADKHFEVVETQILNALKLQNKENLSNLIVAYEPVWAIGTGKTATPEQAQEIHAYIRGVLADNFGEEMAESTPILYGGSVSAETASELFSQPDIDGGLVGGASLKFQDFIQIIGASV